jgi:hypothetical protein
LRILFRALDAPREIETDSDDSTHQDERNRSASDKDCAGSPLVACQTVGICQRETGSAEPLHFGDFRAFKHQAGSIKKEAPC